MCFMLRVISITGRWKRDSTITIPDDKLPSLHLIFPEYILNYDGDSYINIGDDSAILSVR